MVLAEGSTVTRFSFERSMTMPVVAEAPVSAWPPQWIAMGRVWEWAKERIVEISWAEVGSVMRAWRGC
jgi:hypothetical protein